MARCSLSIRACGPHLARLCDLLPSAAVAGWRDGAILHTVAAGLMSLRPSSRLVIRPVTACSGPFSTNKEANGPATYRTTSLCLCGLTDWQSRRRSWTDCRRRTVVRYPPTPAKTCTHLEQGVGVEQFWYCESFRPVGSSGNWRHLDLTRYAAPSLPCVGNVSRLMCITA